MRNLALRAIHCTAPTESQALLLPDATNAVAWLPAAIPGKYTVTLHPQADYDYSSITPGRVCHGKNLTDAQQVNFKVLCSK